MSSISIIASASLGLLVIAMAGCAGSRSLEAEPATPAFYTVTAEIALSRHEPRIAALQYAAATELGADGALLRRAAEVTAETLQPSLAADVAARWIAREPASVDAQRAAARADLSLYRIDGAAAHFGMVLSRSAQGFAAECAALENELAVSDDVFGARQLADRLAMQFPDSMAVRRLQGFSALRADDPEAAVRNFATALAGEGAGGPQPTDESRRELTRGWWRARVLSGDSAEPLAQARALAEGDPAGGARLDYALLLLAAQRPSEAAAELERLKRGPDGEAVALRLLGLIDFEAGRLDDAGAHFAELMSKGKYLDDAFYYLGLIAERHQDLERALRLYAQVRSGDNVLPALLRAAAILRSHGAAPAAEELLDQLVEDEPRRAPEILAARARIYSDAGDAAEALELLSDGAQQYPDSVELRYAIASTYEEQGKVSAALRELRAVLERRPDDPAALNAYGFTLADHRKRLGRARALIEKAHATAPHNAAILDSLGWVLFRQGHGDQALTYLATAYADDRGGDIAAHLGEVLWSQGKQAEAEHVWAEASLTDADNRLLRATRQRLHAAN